MDRQVTLLVADDDPDQRALVSELLSLEGYRVLTARNPQGVLRALTGEVEVLLLDLHGALDESVEAALGRLGAAGPAVVVASGDPDAVTAGKRLGARAVLTKPFGLDELLSTVAGCVAARRAGECV